MRVSSSLFFWCCVLRKPVDYFRGLRVKEVYTKGCTPHIETTGTVETAKQARQCTCERKTDGKKRGHLRPAAVSKCQTQVVQTCPTISTMHRSVYTRRVLYAAGKSRAQQLQGNAFPDTTVVERHSRKHPSRGNGSTLVSTPRLRCVRGWADGPHSDENLSTAPQLPWVEQGHELTALRRCQPRILTTLPKLHGLLQRSMKSWKHFATTLHVV